MSNNAEPQTCPVDPSARAAWLQTARPSSVDSPPAGPLHPAHPLPQPKLSKSRPLSADREISTIPRALTSPSTTTPNPTSTPSSLASLHSPNSQNAPAPSSSGNWIYPSEKMFFDAMRRKDHSPHAPDMAAIVPIHNAVNERAWAEIKTWEDLFGWTRRANTDCLYRTSHESKDAASPKLRSFAGDSTKRSPRAWINTNLWGYREPFDRHDWVVERCGGGGVEYVIDFYEGRGGTGKGGLNFYLDVRPKLNTWEGWKMRAGRILGLGRGGLFGGS